jgi:hypothetical protein
MWYVFNTDKKCICSCDYQPCPDDLKTRGESAIESKDNYDISKLQLDKDNHLVMVEPVVNNDDLLMQIRKKRDGFLRGCQDQVDRFNNQKQAGIATADSPEWIQKVLLYMQQLRDFPEKCDPQNPVWPTPPQG